MARMYDKGVEIVPGFRLVKMLGRGGFGVVWKATAPGGTDAAIKIISLGERTGFKEFRAIRLVKQIRHPNLVPIIAFWLVNEEGKPFGDMVGENTIARKAENLDLIIAMGLGDKSLLDRLRECQKEGKVGIPPEELLSYMEDAARAIDYLNQPVHDLGEGKAGIQHCDIKPQNILIVGGAVQVCDFGLARVLGDSRVTSAKGTAAYMAPELITDNKPSRSTDQYFLGISYVELRTGALPIDVSSPAGAIWAHVQGKLDLSKLPPAEQDVIKQATAVDPEKRYATTAEMVRALRQAIEGAGADGRSKGRMTAARKSPATKMDLVQPGSEVVPGYKLIRLLGQGGYGQVWEASAPGGKHVALKIIRNLEGVHGRQEFKALELIKGVDHNHLMELHAYWLLDRQGEIIPDEIRDRPDAPEPSILVIASKLATMNLLQRLNECVASGLDGIPLAELLGYMRQAAHAIDYLNAPQHQLGDRKVSIQHRDIKPENILLAADVVKVGDFGLAKVVEGSSAVIHGDSTGLTLAYAAPEMFTNVVTNWSDQYCLALTYFKLRTGSWPFPKNSKPNDIVLSHVQGKLDLSGLVEAERAVIARATELVPQKRFPTCTAMIEELECACRLDDTVEVSAGQDDDLPMTRLAALPQASVSPAASTSGKLAAPLKDPAAPEPSTTAHDLREPAGGAAALFETKVFTTPAISLTETQTGLAKTPLKESTTSKLHGSGKPPTLEKIRIDTQEVDLPADTRPAFPTGLKQPPTTWKEPEPPRKVRVTRGSGIKVLAFLLVVVGVLVGSVLVFRTQLLGLFDQSATLTAEAKRLVDEAQFAEALERTRSWRLQSAVAAELRQSIHAAWVRQAKKELDAKEYDRAAQTAGDLVKQFPGDSESRQLLDNARLAVEVRTQLAADKNYAAVDRKLADGPDDAFHMVLRQEVLQVWLAQAKKELYEDKAYAQAGRTAAALLERRVSAEAKTLARQAFLAGQVKELEQQKNFAFADVQAAGSDLDEPLRQTLRTDVLAAWLNQARKELRDDKNYTAMAKTTSELLQRHPSNAAALALRKDASSEMLKDAQRALARGDFAAATRDADKVRNLFGHDGPEAFRILGTAAELQDKPEEAYAAYFAGLPEADKATPDQLELLLARNAFLMNPKWEEYHKRLGFHRGFFLTRLLAAADHGKNLANQAVVEPTLKARAIADAGLARIHASRKLLDLDPAKLKLYHEEAVTLLRTALAQKVDWSETWQWRFELAALLRSLMIGASDAERKQYRTEALKVLDEAKKTAPKYEVVERIQPLIEKLNATK